MLFETKSARTGDRVSMHGNGSLMIRKCCRDKLGKGAAFLARILQHLETPQYLRK